MGIARRSAVIAAKAAKLAILVVMVRCFGPDGTECMLASVRLASGRLWARLSSIARCGGRIEEKSS